MTTKQKPFSKLSATNKRITIAKDVLKQLKLGRLVAQAGTYFTPQAVYREYDDEKELSDVIKDKKCTVCALGSLFVCAVDKLDKLKYGDAYYIAQYEIHTYLKGFFAEDQLRLIESAFERDDFSYDGNMDISVIRLYTKGLNSPKTRMEKIMKNIIRNKGTFVFPKKLQKKLYLQDQ